MHHCCQTRCCVAWQQPADTRSKDTNTCTRNGACHSALFWRGLPLRCRLATAARRTLAELRGFACILLQLCPGAHTCDAALLLLAASVIRAHNRPHHAAPCCAAPPAAPMCALAACGAPGRSSTVRSCANDGSARRQGRRSTSVILGCQRLTCEPPASVRLELRSGMIPLLLHSCYQASL